MSITEASGALSVLDALARKYLSDGDVEAVHRAYVYAADAHAGQHRRSGEDYITHPLAAAQILADLRLDAAALQAALLHDVLEDTDRTLEDVSAKFGPEVSALVDGVTKLSRISWGDLEEEQAENLRKMFLAMAQDIRVVLIKLADRVHNLRTLHGLEPAKRVAVARETMDIYAPLAGRLGIWEIKSELEDLSFRTLDPLHYRQIAEKLAETTARREHFITRAMAALREALERADVQATLSGRPKHIHSIYQKMERKQVGFDEIYDVSAVRVLVNEVKDCYAALGVVHSLWSPIPGEFDDYIATPKDNMYQSLHTSVIALDGRPLEIQIRTKEMHHVAEFGIAAHWRYKEGGRNQADYDTKLTWLRQLMDWQNDLANARDFLESLKMDIFQDQVYVFTPMGDIKELPQGSTPIDFAYLVHTDVGHRCIGAKVNGRLVPLDYQLKTGEIVEIITSRTMRGPSRDWLNSNLKFVKTTHARGKIRQWFRRQVRDENIARGREALEKELKRLGLAQVNYEEIAKLFKHTDVDDFLAAVGYGEVSTSQIATRLAALQEQEPDESIAPLVAPPREARKTSVVEVMGVGDLLTHLAVCCNPVPNDPIVGYITRGRGVTVHRQDCSNMRHISDRERLVPVEWAPVRHEVFPVVLRLEAWDRLGLLRDISTIISEEKLNITSESTATRADHTATTLLTVEVGGMEQLSRLISRLESVHGVIEVRRDSTSAILGSSGA